jgi:hypothetical protein
MKYLYFLILVTHFFSSCSQPSDGRFSVEVNHFFGGAGLTKNYSITNKEVSLITNCDFQNCKSKMVYKRALTKIESDSFYRFLTSSKINRLKAEYIDDNVFDGLHSTISYKVPGFGSDEVQINNVDVPEAERLYREIDKYIDSAKFKFYDQH